MVGRSNPFPADLFEAYAAGSISRKQFIASLESWQTDQGIDLRVRGKCDKSGAYLEYRGCRLRLSKTRRGPELLREAVFRFCREIDFRLRREEFL